MAATDSASLLSAASCDVCFANSPAQLQLVIIGLLRIIAQSLNPMAATDSASLLSASSCDACYANSGSQLQLIMVGLLRIIATNQAVGQTLTGAGAPNGVVTANVGQLYFDTSGTHLWIKVTTSGTNTGWQLLV